MDQEHLFEENMEEEADRDIDELVEKYEKMNNTLQDIKIRKPTRLTDQTTNKKLLKSQYLNEIGVMT